MRRLIANPVIKHNFSQLLQRGGGDGKDGKDRALVGQLADLLEKVRGRGAIGYCLTQGREGGRGAVLTGDEPAPSLTLVPPPAL